MDFASAIHNRQLISFTYDGLPRVVQPATFGQTTTGKLSLCACQIDGSSRRNTPPCWELYTVAKIVGPAFHGTVFSNFAQPGYTRFDSAFTRIIAEH